MKEKFTFWLSIAAIVISIAAVMLVFFRVEPIEVNFFAGLVGVLSLLVIVITWFQISKSITEENRIRNLIKDQVELLTYKEFIRLADMDKEILELLNKSTDNSDKATEILFRIHIDGECENLKSIIRSGNESVDFGVVLRKSMYILGMTHYLIIGMDDKSINDFFDNIIYPFLDELKDFTPRLEPVDTITEEYTEKLKHNMHEFKMNLLEIKYNNTDELIENIQSLLKAQINEGE